MHVGSTKQFKFRYDYTNYIAHVLLTIFETYTKIVLTYIYNTHISVL